MSCSTSHRVCFNLTQPELYAIKLSKKYFVDLGSKLSLVDVFVNMSRFLNCFQLKYGRIFMKTIFHPVFIDFIQIYLDHKITFALKS